MLYNLAQYLVPIFGPARLLQSNAVLICLALYAGFFLTSLLLPKFYKWLPCDRGREFTIHAEAAKGKPTGAGVVFISFFVIIALVFAPVNALQVAIIILTWLTMLTGFLDDRSIKSWGEYRKAALDLLLCLAATAAMLFLRKGGINQEILFWLPFASKQIAVHPVVFAIVSLSHNLFSKGKRMTLSEFMSAPATVSNTRFLCYSESADDLGFISLLKHNPKLVRFNPPS